MDSNIEVCSDFYGNQRHADNTGSNAMSLLQILERKKTINHNPSCFEGS